MADTKISALTALTGPVAETDELVIVDKSDTTHAASGTTKRIDVSEILNKYASDEVLKRVAMMWEFMVADGTTTWSRDSNGVLTAATVEWDRFIEGASDGVFTGTPHGTFVTMWETIALTYPTRSVTVTLDRNIDANGQSNQPTIVVA